MSRGGKGAGRGRGGRRTGPDVAWDDEPIVSTTTRPEPLFPEIDLPVPKPLTQDEIDRVNHYLNFRDEVRNGPLYTILKPSSFTNNKGKTNPRAGFDPFSAVEKYSSKFYKPKRTTPDLSGREYNLKFFPRELWSTIDPERKDPIWKSTLKDLKPSSASAAYPTPISKASSLKRKRPVIPDEDDDDDQTRERSSPSDSNSDAPLSTSRRKKTKASTKKDATQRTGQKRGLEAEDDIPDVEQNEEGDPEDQPEEPQDSEFEESDGELDDYNAEQYFDDGDRDDFDDYGGGGEDTFD